MVLKENEHQRELIGRLDSTASVCQQPPWILVGGNWMSLLSLLLKSPTMASTTYLLHSLVYHPITCFGEEEFRELGNVFPLFFYIFLLFFSNAEHTASRYCLASPTMSSAPSSSSSGSEPNRYFVPGYGISRHIIFSHIQFYLGPYASVRPYSYQGREGYLVTAPGRPLTKVGS